MKNSKLFGTNECISNEQNYFLIFFENVVEFDYIHTKISVHQIFSELINIAVRDIFPIRD